MGLVLLTRLRVASILRLEKLFMHAICLTKYGSIDNFVGTDLPTPKPKRGQVRVRVHASAVGPADFKVATGLFRFLHGRQFPVVLGYVFSGVVDAVDEGQTRWKIGDSVFGFLPYNHLQKTNVSPLRN